MRASRPGRAPAACGSLPTGGTTRMTSRDCWRPSGPRRIGERCCETHAMDDRQLARSVALSRIGIGIALLLAPARAGERWIGPTAHDPAAKMMIRGVGIRDVALGAGTYQALANGDSVRPWLQAGVASDAVDAVAA